MSVYDQAMRLAARFQLPGNVVFAGFDGDGKRLLAMTGAQQVFLENLP